MYLSPDRRATEVALHFPATIPIFEAAGIEYSYDTGESLRGASVAAGISVAALLQELDRSVGEPPPPDLQTFVHSGSISDLGAHLLHRQSQIRSELRRIEGLLEALLAQANLAGDALLAAAQQEVTGLSQRLGFHAFFDEDIMVPFITRLEFATRFLRPIGDDTTTLLRERVQEARQEHAEFAKSLRHLQKIIDSYAPESDPELGRRVAMYLLRQLVPRMRHHLHVENNVLIPRALALVEETVVPEVAG